jgi:myosin-crossreactive antigen
MLSRTTWGHKFFNEHMAYIYGNKIDEMIDDQYAQDGIPSSSFNVLPTPPPHVIRGNQALKKFFRTYIDWQGSINLEEVTNFAETEKSLFFQEGFTSKTGRWAVGDAWHMRDGKIEVHYRFAQKIG